MSSTTQCQECRSSIAATATGCATCGASAVVCDSCGLQSRVGVRFCNRCGEPLRSTAVRGLLRPGQALQNGSYTIIRTLSRGGMGHIYLARDHRAFDRDVVIKALIDYFDPTNPLEVQAAHARFINEARTLAGLDHPAIPKIYTHLHEGDHNYIVMAYINGNSLDQALSQQNTTRAGSGQPYAIEQVQAWGIELCQVLEYLAERTPPVVHQDIKPANIIRDQHGALRLVDFGTARTRAALSPSAAGAAAHGQSAVFGTPGYAPPEQYRGRSEPRSDVYALAATLYHLATDDDPAQHPQQFPRLTQLGELGRVLQDALQQEVYQRPTARELRRRLEGTAGLPRAAAREATRHRLRSIRQSGVPTVSDATVLRLSPDRHYGAVAGTIGSVMIWPLLSSGAERRIIIGATIRDLCWSSDGSELAAATVDGRLVTIDVGRGHIRHEQQLGGSLRAVTRAGAAGAYDVLRSDGTLWSVTAQHVQQRRSVGSGNGAYVCLARHPDGTRLALGTAHGAIEIRNADDLQLTATLNGHNGAITAVAWEPHGERFASVGGDGHLRIWRSGDVRQIGGDLLSRAELCCLDWSSDGSWIAAAGADQRIFAYDTLDGRRIHDISGYSGDIRSITFLPRSLNFLATGSGVVTAVSAWQIDVNRG